VTRAGGKTLALASRRVSGLSGAVRLILEEARAASSAGWRVEVVSERLDAAAVRAVGAVPRPVLGWPWGSWLKRRAFAALASRETRGAEVVHGHGDLLAQDLLSLHNCVHAAFEAAEGRPLPASDATGRMHALQLSQKRFRLLAANSRLMKEDVERRFAVPDDLISVVYPGYDDARFRAAQRPRLGAAARNSLGVGREDVLFGLITSGDFAKRGLGTFLRAFALAAKRLPRARALVVGKETRPGPYVALAAELGVGERVIFSEPRADVESVYHALDVYVHAARFEEFGMTLLEAMACGVPAVSGARTGAAELFGAAQHEFVLPDVSPEPLAAAMIRLGESADLRAAVGLAAAADAAPWTLSAHGRAVLSLYERLLKK
jgi:UDP-glucose:(heptosyl)LPS alpha-1,3-glucosyltransferase